VKLLLVDLERTWRGGQNQALLILKALNARGDVAELVTVKGSALGKRAAARRVKTHFVPRHTARLSATLKILKLTRGGAFDIVHANEAHAVTAVWLAQAHRHAAFVISRRVGYALSKGRVAQARYKAAARIVAISNWVADRLIESGAPKEKISVVYEGVDIPALPSPDARQHARARWKIAEDAPLLGSVGVLLPDKGHEVLIRALAQLREDFPNCRLLLAGSGAGRDALQLIATELGVADMVIFAGFVADIETVYAALDVFLFPSYFEGLGTSLLAAMSYQIPSVAFQCCAFGEIIEDGKNGFLVESGSVDEIVKAIKKILRKPKLAKSIGEAGRERIEEHFSSGKMIDEMSRVYREVVTRETPSH
jgi:glycosyltransferase involved in cell wall biosynthesis